MLKGLSGGTRPGRSIHVSGIEKGRSHVKGRRYLPLKPVESGAARCSKLYLLDRGAGALVYVGVTRAPRPRTNLTITMASS